MEGPRPRAELAKPELAHAQPDCAEGPRHVASSSALARNLRAQRNQILDHRAIRGEEGCLQGARGRVRITDQRDEPLTHGSESALEDLDAGRYMKVLVEQQGQAARELELRDIEVNE